MLTAVILSNINPIFAKLIYQSGLSPSQLYFVVLLITGLLLAVYQVVEMEHGVKWGMTKDDWLGTVIAAVTGGTIAPLLFFEGLNMVNASTSIILTSLLPFFVVIMAVLLLKESFTPRLLFGGALIVAGLASLLWKDIMAFNFRPGVGMIVLSSLCTSFTIIGHKKFVKHRHIDSIVLVRTLISIVLVGGWMLLTDSGGFGFLVQPQNIWLILALPICSFFIPFFLYFRALANLTASDAGVMEAFGRIFGIIAAATILGEALGPEHLLSTVLASFGILIINVPLTKWRIAPSRLPVVGPLRK